MPVRDVSMAPGLFGKLPAFGDFLSRGLAHDFTKAWDGWLQAGILASREALGEAWLEIYLTSPLWHYALAAGACGPEAMAGVLMPSVDRVGRYFPFTLACPLPQGTGPFALRRTAATWYAGAEELARAALQAGAEIDQLLADLEGLGAPPAAPAPARARLAQGLVAGLEDEQGEAALLALLADLAPPGSLWWSEGSARVPPVMLAAAGLPPAEAFAAMLGGDFAARGLCQVSP
jgi:type VI secretion system protein ImpM